MKIWITKYFVAFYNYNQERNMGTKLFEFVIYLLFVLQICNII